MDLLQNKKVKKKNKTAMFPRGSRRYPFTIAIGEERS